MYKGVCKCGCSGKWVISVYLSLWEKQVAGDDSYLTVKLIFQAGSHPVLLARTNIIAFVLDYTLLCLNNYDDCYRFLKLS